MLQVIINVIRSTAQRPRLEFNAITLGKGAILARRVVEKGYWCIRRSDDARIAALLSVAYGKRIATDNPLFRAVIDAANVLQRNPEQAAAMLSGLPEPTAEHADKVGLADTLLKAGTRPADLATAVRRAPLGLRPTPSYAEGLALCDKGVALGVGTVVAPLADLPDGRTGLAIEGREERIAALLSLAKGEMVGAPALRQLALVSKALARGDAVHATFLLCHVGQPPLPDREFAKALDVAARDMDNGGSPFDWLKGAGLLPQGMGYGAWSKHLVAVPQEPWMKDTESGKTQDRDECGRYSCEGGGTQVADASVAETPKNADDVSRDVMDQLGKMNAVAFVGGGFDQTVGHSVEYAAELFEKNHPGVKVIYFTHDQGDALASWIADQKAAGNTVGVVAHSWGADTAANVVANGAKVDLLVTVDPVGQDLADGYQDPPPSSPSDLPQLAPPKGKTMADTKSNAKTWVNIYLSGQPGAPSDGDRIANVGGRWKNRPSDFATRHYVVGAGHEKFNLIVPRKK